LGRLPANRSLAANNAGYAITRILDCTVPKPVSAETRQRQSRAQLNRRC